MKLCSCCGRVKFADKHFQSGLSPGGYHSWCRICCAVANQKSRAKKYLSIEGRASTMMQSCRTNSKKRGHPFDITQDYICEIWRIQGGICAYTGREMTLDPSKPNSVSIERIDSSKGYLVGNVVLVCNIVNKMKTDLSYEEFVDTCRSVSNFLYSNGKMVKGVAE